MNLQKQQLLLRLCRYFKSRKGELAYAELYFTDTLWPDFDAAALDDALNWYIGRERRFGMTSEQLREIG